MDLDGDGKTDYAVWRQPTGYWYVKKSSTGATQSQQWGSSELGDIPMGMPLHLYFSSLPAITPPTVSTQSASSITGSLATQGGSVNPNGYATTAWFEYGTSSGSLTQKTPVQNLGSGSTAKPFNASISGLAAGTKYSCREVGQNGGGTTQWTILSFTTQTSGGGGIGLFPHTLGSSWHYRITRTADNTYYDEIQTVTESTANSFTVKKNSFDLHFNDNTYEKWAIDGNAYGITERGDADDKGIFTPESYNVPMDVVIPPDITIGSVFHGITTFSTASIYYTTTYSYELKVAGYENVSVPGGNFTNALKVVYTDYQDSVPWSMSSWWVDGVGFVKWVEPAGVNGEKYVYELVSWSMK